MRVCRTQKKLIVEADISMNTRLGKLPAAKWDKQHCYWTYPLEMVLAIWQLFPSAEWSAGATELLNKAAYAEEEVAKLKAGDIELEPHAFLLKHQELCRQIARRRSKYAFYCDVGTGKTILAYSIMNDNRQFKWVVISPRSIIKTAWIQDHKDFYPDLKVLPLYSAMKTSDYKELADEWGVGGAVARLRAKDVPIAMLDYADIVVTNIELFKSKYYINQWNYEGMFVDEASIMKNKDTQATQSILSAMKKCQKGYLLSGKPAPNSELEYFTQMEAVDPSIFGTSYYSFRAKYFEPMDWFQRDWELMEGKRDDFTKRLAKGCIFIRKEDCLDLPPVMPPVIREITLTGEAFKYYKDMEKEQVLMFKEGGVLTASTKLAAMMKLRQITSGFVIDTEDESKVVRLHNAKSNELASVVAELGDRNAVIWINFKAEVEEISALLDRMGKTYVTAYSGTKNTDDSIEAFKEGRAQFIIAHPKTLKYGVTFTGSSMKQNCTYAIYYSMSYSYEDYYQSYHRIYRKGQTESCTYIYLVVENSVDGDIYDALVNKATESAIIENLVRRYDEGK